MADWGLCWSFYGTGGLLGVLLPHSLRVQVVHHMPRRWAMCVKPNCFPPPRVVLVAPRPPAPRAQLSAPAVLWFTSGRRTEWWSPVAPTPTSANGACLSPTPQLIQGLWEAVSTRAQERGLCLNMLQPIHTTNRRHLHELLCSRVSMCVCVCVCVCVYVRVSLPVPIAWVTEGERGSLS